MIAITGANGLLGSFIVRQLIQSNKPFVALKRPNSDISLLDDVETKITWRNADILDSVALDEALDGVTHVIHAAAIVSFNPRLARKLHEVNIIGTRHVVNACLARGVKKLVHVSSVAALGRMKDQTHIDENHKWVDNALNSTYAETKYLAELEVFRGHEEGLNTIILNPSVILAAADWNKSSAKLFKYVWDQRKFYIDKDLNYVDARDVADAAVRFLEIDRPGERYILNGGSITIEEFFKQVALRLHKKPPSIRVNETFLKLIAFLESFRANLMRSEPLITNETARLAGTYFFYNNQKLRNQLNFEFQTIDKTLDWCCEYYIAVAKGKK